MAIDKLSAKTLAKALECHAQTIYNITNPSDPQKISHRMALKLSSYFGHSPEFWRQDAIEPEQLPITVAAGGMGSEPEIEKFAGGGLLVDHEINTLLEDENSGLAIVPHNESATQSVSYDLTYGLSIEHGYKKLTRPEWRMVHTREFNPDRLDRWERDLIEPKLDALIERSDNGDDDADRFFYTQDSVTLKPFKSVRVLAKEHLNFGPQYAAFVGGTTKNTMDGLLVVPGLQVDPGYRGPMFFFVTNLNPEAVTLEPDQKLATLAIFRLTKKPEKAYKREVEKRMREVADGIRKGLIELFDFDKLKYSKGIKITFGEEIIQSADGTSADSFESAHSIAIRWILSKLGSEEIAIRERLIEAALEVLGAVPLDREAAKLVSEYLSVDADQQKQLLSIYEGPTSASNVPAKTAFERLGQNPITALQAILAD
ncbi:hypothetical protein [Pontixanthobacter sp. CEM42]|uniref:dCTP deaminase domain-containing protein n=1 Tax=Pontixanthobacter sp. CEM42 TaxID=2792077 RepID=UPI001AE0934A|nr:hypothetical protein [Pontixanthobacter sp. CEM42]